MGNRIKYYLKSSSLNIKNSALIVIAFSITLSLISGLEIYSSSYQNRIFQNSFTQIADYDLIYSQSTYQVSTVFNTNLEDKVDSLLSGDDLMIQDNIKYASYSSDLVKLYKNFTSILPNEELLSINCTELPFSLLYIDSSFYHTQRFTEYFDIIEGNFPTSASEILIDIGYAHALGLSVNDSTQTYLKANKEKDYIRNYYHDSYENESMDYTAPDIVSGSEIGYSFNYTICGIYVAKISSYQMGTEKYFRSYDYDEKSKSIGLFDIVGNKLSPIFGYYSFSLDNTTNNTFCSIEHLAYSMDHFFDKIQSSHLFYPKYGRLIFLDRSDYTFNTINANIDRVGEGMSIIRTNLSDSIQTIPYTWYKLKSVQSSTTEMRLNLFIMEIPLIVGAILLGSFARKTEIKSRLEDFFLLKSKGVPPQMIITQLMCENIQIGVVSTFFGILIGIGVFLTMQNIFSTIFSVSGNLPLILTSTMIFKTLSIGIGLSILGSIFAIIYLLKIPINEVLFTTGTNELDELYDEKSLFHDYDNKESLITGKNENNDPNILKDELLLNTQDENTKNFSGFKSQSELHNKMVEKTSEFSYNGQKAVSSNQKAKNNMYYKDPIKSSESEIQRFSYVLILVSLIPLILFYIIYLGTLDNASDSLISFSSNFYDDFNFLTTLGVIVVVIAMISPIFIVWGVIRFFTKENPSLFANFSKNIFKFHLKERSFLVGIDMVRKKQYKIVILIIAIFTATFSYANLYLNTTTVRSNIYFNLEVGADIKTKAFSNNLNLDNVADINSLETQMKSYHNSEYDDVQIENVLTFYLETHESPDFISYNIDFGKYLELISEGGKYIPNSITRSLKSIIKNNLNSSGSLDYPQVAVSNEFLNLNLLEIGDLFNFTHFYVNTELNLIQNQTFPVQIANSYEYLPGIFAEDEAKESIVIFESKFLDNHNSTKHYGDVYQFIDFKSSNTYSDTFLKKFLQNATLGHIYIYSEYHFYIQDWKMFTIQQSISQIGIYGVLYLDFIMIGILIAFGIAVLIIALEKDNKHNNGVLLARGFGKKGLLQLIISEVSILFIVGIFIGMFSGLIYSMIFTYIEGNIQGGGIINNLPFYINFKDLFGILFSIVGLSLLISYIAYYFESRQNITKFFHTF